MKIYAHRGIWDSCPENSRSAIEGALSKGFGVELDIRFTRDKKIVIMHDSDLVRLCGVDRNVNDLTSAEISNFPFLSKPDESPVFFDDLASYVWASQSEVNVAVHFKQEDQDEENCSVVSKLFEKHDLYVNCFLFNLSLEACQMLRRMNPEIRLSVLVSDNKFEPFVYLWDEVKYAHNLFDIVWAAEYKKLFGGSFFDEIHKLGKKAIAVSPELHREFNHPNAFDGYQAYWHEFVNSRIAGVCTDFPTEFLQFLSNQENHSQFKNGESPTAIPH